MDKLKFKRWQRRISQALLFAVTIGIVLFFFPRQGKFRYQFQEGRPWRYGLLTAPFDFAVYKSDDLLTKERDSINALYRPYYRFDDNQVNKQVETLRSNYDASLHLKCSPQTMRYIESSLRGAYSKGIIESDDLEKMVDLKYESIFLITNNVSKSVSIQPFLTIPEAYKLIVDNAPRSINREELLAADVDQYLSDNILFDEQMSNYEKEQLSQSVSTSKGMVQKGEKIVDRGEIVTHTTYEILDSFRQVSEHKSELNKQLIWVMLGQAVVIISLFVSLFFYLFLFRPKLLEKKENVIFILTMILGAILLTEIVVDLQMFSIYVIPYAIVPILIRTFFDSRTALFAHNVTVLICAFMYNVPFEFVLLQVTVGMTAIHSLKDLTQRSQLIRSALIIILTYSVMYVGDALIVDGDWRQINGRMFVYFGVNGILIMFSYLLMYIVEKTFGYTSNVTLVELSNINDPIFRQLSEKCPGTFQHSLQVANLAAEAANEIGAYVQLARTGALYHDIGKLENPSYFTENQAPGYNPHDELDFESSAKVIINHVTDGMKMADKLRLPNSIKGFIRSHHGTTKARYFYNSCLNANPDAAINEENFTYPGPPPYSKETAIVMMADAIEASSRSLQNINEKSITEMVNNIVRCQLSEGQFDNAPITLKDIEKVKAVFINKLLTIHHSRITYPELNRSQPNSPVPPIAASV